MKETYQRGFTLVEIAIVLVIISLLLGAILKGTELITEAKVRHTADDLNGITAAYYAYIDRYHALPGDDSHANTRWPLQVLPADSSGNGNGIIEGNYLPQNGQETEFFWMHLQAAGFITGSSLLGTPPVNFAGGFIGVQTGDGGFSGEGGPGAVLSDGGAFGTGFSTLMVCSSNLPDRVAGAVDTQLDNGNPQTGIIHAARQADNVPLPSNAFPFDTYPDGTGSPFTLCRVV